MGTRKRIARTVEDVSGMDYKEVLKKAKLRYRSERNFYLFKAYEGSSVWCALSYIINPNMTEEHWTFNEQLGKWNKVAN